MGEKVILRRDADLSFGEALVKFRLFYEGPLFASKGDAFDGQVDRRRSHKHDIRIAFHRQLKHFWHTHPWLKDSRAAWDVLGIERENKPLDQQPFMWENIARLHEVCGRQFVPLVCEQFKLLCDLDVLMLRRDRPGGIFQARDIDNRLKTLFDALRMPKNGLEIEGLGDEDEMIFVLLQDDSLISSVTVETDELLESF